MIFSLSFHSLSFCRQRIGIEAWQLVVCSGIPLERHYFTKTAVSNSLVYCDSPSSFCTWFTDNSLFSCAIYKGVYVLIVSHKLSLTIILLFSRRCLSWYRSRFHLHIGFKVGETKARVKPPLESPGRLTNVLVITRLLHIKFDVASSNFNPWLCRLVWLFLHFLHSRPPLSMIWIFSTIIMHSSWSNVSSMWCTSTFPIHAHWVNVTAGW